MVFTSTPLSNFFSILLLHSVIGLEFPPGPIGLPVVGNIPALGFTPYKKILDWKSRYGPIVGLQFGNYRAVAISDYKLIKEALNNYDFAGRPKIDLFIDRVGGKPEGVLFTEGRHWHEQRNFTINQFNTFPFGDKSLEEIINKESQYLAKNLRKKEGRPINLSRHIKGAVVNVMWNIIAGQSFAQGDPTLDEVIKLIEANSEKNTIRTAINVFLPSYAKVAPSLSHYERAQQPVKNLVKFLQPYIEEHRHTWSEGRPRDYIDSYISEVNQTMDLASSFHKTKFDSMVYTVADLFVAGVETVGATLNWISLILVKHQKVQAKMSAEIQRVVGTRRIPNLQDRASLPYTNAVIAEVMRYRTLVPLAIFHRTTRSVEFHGFGIPNNTMIHPNIYAAHHDPKVWGDPEVFRPERFLSADGATFVTPEAFMPFSVGHRRCLGAKVAEDEIFLFVSAFFQAFQVANVPGSPMPSLVPLESALSLPQTQKLIVNTRD